MVLPRRMGAEPVALPAKPPALALISSQINLLRSLKYQKSGLQVCTVAEQECVCEVGVCVAEGRLRHCVIGDVDRLAVCGR